MTRHRAWPVAAFFALNGFVFASLYGRLPAIKADLGLSDGQLGIALAGITAGLLASQALSGALITRFGSAPITALGASLGALLVVAPALAGSLAALVAACAAVGFANGILDVAMNVQGVTVEERIGRPVFSALHALFSAGVLAGSLAAAALADLDVTSHLAVIGGAGLLLTALAGPRLERGDARPGAPAFARPSRLLVGLGAIAFAALLCEGAVADWSAVHLRETLDSSEAVAPLALAAFSVTMIAGRLAADRIATAVGFVTYVRAGGAIAATGLLLAALAPTPAVSIAGFTVAGVGLSGLFPLVLRKGGEAPQIAAISTLGYAGLVTGPPLVGALAQAASLRTSLAVILGALSIAIVVVGHRPTGMGPL